MKILVIGLGSMGKRRIRLLQKISASFEITGVDNNARRLQQAGKELGINVENSLEEALCQNYHCALVCTSPLQHATTIKKLLCYDIFIFTELNLLKTGYEMFMNKENENRLFLSSTLLYRKDIQYIEQCVRGKQLNYSYHVGQYLPDWHPWENYKDYFIGNKATNGCREIMSIDFPWLISCFGKVVNFFVLKGKMSKLDIDYDDNFLLLLEHQNGAKGMFAVDIVSRKPIRKLEVFSEDIHIFGDGKPDTLKEYNIDNETMTDIMVYDHITKAEGYCENIIEDAYIDELKAFLQMVQYNDKRYVRYDFVKDWDTLSLIDKIEGID